MSTPHITDLTSVLRLEVETAPIGGNHANLIPNPDGSQGGYGWITVDSTTASNFGFTQPAVNGVTPVLRYMGEINQASTLRTESFTVTTGYVLATRFTALATSFFYRAQVEWLNIAGGVVSASGLTGYLSGSTTPVTINATVPASVYAARLRFDLYDTNSGTIPAAVRTLDLTAVAAICEPTTPAIGWTTNEAWTNLFTAATEIHVSRHGLDVGELTATIYDSTLDPLTSPLLTPGKRCRLTCRLNGTGAYTPLFTGWLKAPSATYDQKRQNSPAAVVRGKATAITLTATDAVDKLANAGRPEGSSYQYLGRLLEGCGVPWNIGSTAYPTGGGNGDVDWTNDSASALDQIVVARDTVHGYAWVNRSGVFRFEAYGDPPALSNNLYAQVTAFTTTNCSVTYAGGVATLTATAAGDAVVLSNLIPLGLSKYVTFGGYGKTFASGDVNRAFDYYPVFYDASGTVVGQGTGTSAATAFAYINWAGEAPANATGMRIRARAVSLTAGQKFVFAMLTLQTPVTLLTAADYTAVPTSFAVNRLINQVDISLITSKRDKSVAFGPWEYATVETPYGPYRNEGSVRQWGSQSAKFTILYAGTTPDAFCATFANEVLAGNSKTSKHIDSVTMRISSYADLTLGKVFLDVYDNVQVRTTAADQRAFLTDVSHSITPGEWLMEIDFDVPGSVPAPLSTPSVQGGAAATEGVWIAPTLTGTFTNYGAGYDTVGYMRKNGIVYLKGLAGGGALNTGAFNLPVGYRPQGDLLFTVMQGNNLASRLHVRTSDGAVYFDATFTNATYSSFAGVVFPAGA